MSSKSKSLLWLGVFLLIQLLALAAFLGQYELVVHQGTEVRLPCTGVDPFDPFRGRYVRTRTTLEYTLKDDAERQFVREHSGKTIFVRLAENPGTPGIFHGVEMAEEPGPDGVWMSVKMDYWFAASWEDKELLVGEDGMPVVESTTGVSKRANVNLRLPQQQLFLNEQIAFRAEKILASVHENAVAVYRIRKGRAVLMDIEVEGKSLRQRAAEEPDASEVDKEKAREIDPDSFSQRVM